VFTTKVVWIVFLNTLLLQAAILDDVVDKIQSYGASHMHYKKYHHSRHTQKEHKVSDEAKWQLALYYLGYYHGKIDGDLLTPESYHAIELFQHKYQSLASGLLAERFKPYLSDIYLQLKMKKDLSYEGKEKIKNSKKIQTALQVMGFYEGKIDGKTGEKTKSAIKLYVESKEYNKSSEKELDADMKKVLIQDAVAVVEKKLGNMKQESYFNTQYAKEEIETDNDIMAELQ